MLKNKENSKKDKHSRPMSLTVKAVVAVGDEVLLLKRAKKCKWNSGKWDLPGGHIDEEETVVEAIKREVKEETGLEVEVGEVIRVSEFEKEHPAFQEEKRGLRYLAFADSKEVTVNDREHQEFKWEKIDEAIARLSDENGFEKEKKETLKEAKKFLEMKRALNGWKRSLADFENYKRRMKKSKEEFQQYCIEDFVSDLLPVVDNFAMAVSHVPEDQKNSPWMTGVLYIQDQLLKVLQEKGVEKMEVKEGDEVDANIHEVIASEDTKEEESKDDKERINNKEGVMKVGKVLKEGYMIGDKVIRPATVQAGE